MGTINCISNNFNFNKPNKIVKDNETYIIFERIIYRKAWFHENFTRWDVKKYEEAGTNVPLYAYEDTSIKYFVFNFVRSNMKVKLKREDLDAFYYENPQCKINSFGQYVILVPLSICKEYE